MNNKPEVLAPAGGPESLEAAVRAGADAVYLGASRFSARAGARNFDTEALRSAVEYCHARGVKVHLALNTILSDSELPGALRLAEYACSLPVDAVIVQDAGLLRLLKRYAPALPLHASTQMSVHTPAAVRILEEAGVSRVVLSREMSLREIAQVRAETRAELEAFVHGALCMSVSGQCYFSAALGGRSGNRGQCAQPCRLPFAAEGGTGHDLSLKDLSMIERAGELAKAGVCSLKIEGRMKRPEYVAAATRACRIAVDGSAPPPDLMRNLRAVFSRSGFTTGYPDGVRGREMFGARTREDVTAATEHVFAQLRDLYRRETPRVPVCMAFTARAGEPAVLAVSDAEGRLARVEGAIPQPAGNRALTGDACADQLKKTGGTPYLAESVSCMVAPGLNLPMSALNAMRREALERLTGLRCAPPENAPVWCEPEQANSANVPARSANIPARSVDTLTRCAVSPPVLKASARHERVFAFRARFSSAAQMPEEAGECECIYLPFDTPAREFSNLLGRGYRVAAELPRGLFGMSETARAVLKECRAAGVRDVWAGTLDAAGIALDSGMRVHGGFSLNIANTEALAWYADRGLADAELSLELSLPQAAETGGDLPRGLVLYGRIPLMLTRNCPAANGPGGCRGCKTPPVLTDRKGIKFPIQCAGACSEVLNSVPLYLADRMAEVRGAEFGVLRFTTESKEEAARILREYREALAGTRRPVPPETGYTRGLYYKSILSQK